jgi:hypothetical protein
VGVWGLELTKDLFGLQQGVGRAFAGVNPARITNITGKKYTGRASQKTWDSIYVQKADTKQRQMPNPPKGLII